MRLNILLLLLIATNVVTAQSIEDAAKIKQADAELNQHILESNVREAARYYAQDFMLITSSGIKKDRDAMIQEIGSPELVLEVNRTENVTVRVEGTTAVLTGVLRQKGIYKGKTFDALLKVTDTWIRTVDGWKIIAGHVIPVPKS
jgi:ketosteroid isomerase-like protein